MLRLSLADADHHRNAPFRNPIRSEVDLDANGKHAGNLRVPHSAHRSAYGWVPVPIVSIRNGCGPVVCVMAGNHGDEYEGQIVVSRVVREIDAAQIAGQLIVLPMANFPAADAGLRVSPIDGGNLSRCVPGDPAGAPTAVIADDIDHVLLPETLERSETNPAGRPSFRASPARDGRRPDATPASPRHRPFDVFTVPAAHKCTGRDAAGGRIISPPYHRPITPMPRSSRSSARAAIRTAAPRRARSRAIAFASAAVA
ncbi:succinylglutamate desuccinylase / Aspartoacylase family protein [Burkholderia thailandensis E264]|uniref:Succinylglutamate desuccinylase/Aspartoacylase catalytic domain-containing protein n=1 Tax=Burkholderia thailandensis (strain ATCC 700388 / DSM 13276 / CCUG 48851 / CIP 106301 / E264) TaxID=271848 RepID=Q2T7E5_BURTA|nr:conserved hypothetical protein [Burkholderia thailandensis E264]AHI76500.1 succinylglutamate desuccinylase / Aspartoacylase family protein [Burkholderia thailandensis 2002721723]AIP28927.1 succinylglutamate desuccinylase / Aspartoacylase family protein [Burkholderia thailandensis E264]AJY02662.1 succinylglutamate desuccinylase / Aspartoacylase family protein [Burkholderia thailandensis 2002721643]